LVQEAVPLRLVQALKLQGLLRLEPILEQQEQEVGPRVLEAGQQEPLLLLVAQQELAPLVAPKLLLVEVKVQALAHQRHGWHLHAASSLWGQWPS
jgi:hypothetical protein